MKDDGLDGPYPDSKASTEPRRSRDSGPVTKDFLAGLVIGIWMGLFAALLGVGYDKFLS